MGVSVYQYHFDVGLEAILEKLNESGIFPVKGEKHGDSLAFEFYRELTEKELNDIKVVLSEVFPHVKFNQKRVKEIIKE